MRLSAQILKWEKIKYLNIIYSVRQNYLTVQIKVNVCPVTTVSMILNLYFE